MRTNIRTLTDMNTYSVKVDVIVDEQWNHRLTLLSDMSFMEAADYALEAQKYFSMAILHNAEWQRVEIEIGSTGIGTVQLIEITRD